MRTLAVAQAWRLDGGAVRYVARELPDALEDRLRRDGCDVERWPDITAGSAADGRRLRDAVSSGDAAAVLVDGYAFGDAFRRQLSGTHATTMLLHDYGMNEPLWLDFILNANPHARRELYPLVDGRRQLLGLRWAMLRREFVTALRHGGPAPDARIPGRARVLVTLGGGDPHDVTGRIIDAMEAVDRPLEVCALVGAANPHMERLRRRAARSRHTIRVCAAVDDMPAMMAWADVAVAAAGSTSWELAWMGVPWLSIAFADNQRPILDELHARGLAVALGWHDNVTSPKIAEALSTLLTQSRARARLAAKVAPLIDGAGAARIAGVLRGHA